MDTCRAKLGHFAASFAWVKSRWMKDLDIGPKAIKLLEENMGSRISDLPLSNIFWM